jgi:hypothetical protein
MDDACLIPLRDRHGTAVAFAHVSPEDLERVSVSKWTRRVKSTRKSGQHTVHAVSANGYLHHFINGHPPTGLVTDHINGNSLDCRRSNLRNATRSQNAQNIPKGNGGTSRYKGVGKRQNGKGRWRARLGKKHVGTFETELGAAKAYDRAALDEYGPHALLNGVLTTTEREGSSQEGSRPIKALPKGVTLQNGLYYAQRERAGIKHYLGRFATSEQAEEGRSANRDVTQNHLNSRNPSQTLQ